MKILAFSDIHRDTSFALKLVEASSDADILVGAGDFATCGEGALDVLTILKEVEIPTVIVSGNHDQRVELEDFCQGWAKSYFLHGSNIIVDGINIFGLGCEIPQFDHSTWNESLSEAEAAAILEHADPYDILVTHTPPHGHVDMEVDGNHHGDHDGSTSVLESIQKHQPAFHFCGHMHDSWGQKSFVGKTAIHNLGPTLNWFTI